MTAATAATTEETAAELRLARVVAAMCEETAPVSTDRG